MSITYTHTRLFLTILVSALFLYVLYTAQQAILLVVFAAILSIGLTGAVQTLSESSRLSRGVSYFVVTGGCILTLVLIGWLGAPALQAQFSEFTQFLNDTPTLFAELPLIPDDAPSIRTLLQQNVGGVLSGLQSFFTATITLFTFTIICVFIMLYGSWQGDLYRSYRDRLAPPERYARLNRFTVVSVRALRFWLLGRLASMVVVGIITYLGLIIFDIPLALLLATTAGLLSFIPNIGPLLSLIPAVLVTASSGWPAVLTVILIYTAAQFLESYLITPFIQQRFVHIPPAALLAGQVILGAAFGILGLLLAAPLGAMAIAILNESRPEGPDIETAPSNS